MSMKSANNDTGELRPAAGQSKQKKRARKIALPPPADNTAELSVLNVEWLSADAEANLMQSEETAIRLLLMGEKVQAVTVLRYGGWRQPEKRGESLQDWIERGCPPAKIISAWTGKEVRRA